MALGIKSKLIITLVTANCIIAASLYWLSSKSFDQDFLGYITQIELQKLEPLTQELALLYQQKKGWQWIDQEHYIWRHVMDYHVRKQSLESLRQTPRPNERRPNFGGRPSPSWLEGRPPPPRFEGRRPLPRPQGRQAQRIFQPKIKRVDERVPNFDQRFILRNEWNEILVGRIIPDQTVEWLPISVDGKRVGDLGVVYRKSAASNLEDYFIDQQKAVLANVVLVMFIVAMMVALLLSSKLTAHIRLLQQGLSKLVAGNYEHALDITSKDELGQLASDFNFLSQTLKENKLSRQQWIADISHELRTPVSILKGELEALVEGVRQIDDAALKSLQQETERLTLLINDLHELSLSDVGALSYQKEHIDIVELVTDFTESQKLRIDSKGLILHFHTNVPDYCVLIDGDRIEQCLKNLLQNSLRYTDAPGQIHISLQSTATGIDLVWEDSSPGVSAAEMSHLFERLYRVEKSRNRAKGGAGLGMSICKNIIDAHDAKIELFQSDLKGLGIKISFSAGNNHE